MQEISPAIRYFGMDRAHPVCLARALREGELGPKTVIEEGALLWSRPV